MRKLVLTAIICASLSLPLCTFVVRATTQVGSVDDLHLGMDIADALTELQGKYSIVSTDLEKGSRSYALTGGPDRRFEYEIDTLNGKVASIWTNDAQSYSGDASIVGTELFDRLYAAGQPSRGGTLGEALGMRYLTLSVELQRPVTDSSSRTLIFDLPGEEDFRLSFWNPPDGTPSLSVQRVRALDEKAFHKLLASPASSVK